MGLPIEAIQRPGGMPAMDYWVWIRDRALDWNYMGQGHGLGGITGRGEYGDGLERL